MQIETLPCVIKGMPNSEYHSPNGYDGRSFLEAVRKWGGEAQLWLESGKSLFGGNTGTSIGSEFDAIVTGILDGKSFDSMIVSPPTEVLAADGSKRGKAYQEWLKNQDQNVVIATDDKKVMYSKMLDSMRGNDAVYELMQKTTGTQWSVFFEAYDHKLKVRPDACCDHLWWDLKTTSSGLDKIWRSVLEYGYHSQDWMYVEGAKALGYEEFRMPFVFVQTCPPYSCRAYTLPEELVQQAGRQMISTMEDVRLRRSTGLYMPAEAGMVQEMVIPQWALKGEEIVEI